MSFGLNHNMTVESLLIHAKNQLKSLATAEMKESLRGQGLDAVGNSPEQFAALIRSELPKWAKVVKESGVRLE